MDTSKQAARWTATQRGDMWCIERPDGSTVLSIHRGAIPTAEDLPKILASPALYAVAERIARWGEQATGTFTVADLQGIVSDAHAALASARGEG